MISTETSKIKDFPPLLVTFLRMEIFINRGRAKKRRTQKQNPKNGHLGLIVFR